MSEDRWAIRGMDHGDREAAIAASRRMGMTLAVWLGLAIREKLAREREQSETLQGEVVNLFDTSEAPVAGEPREEYHVDHRLMLLEPLSPPTIEDIGRALEIAEKLASLRGHRVSPRITGQAERALLRRLTATAPGR
jgi:hypothetical protein